MEFEIENELITVVELQDFEQKLEGLKLPKDYIDHMLKYNGDVFSIVKKVERLDFAKHKKHVLDRVYKEYSDTLRKAKIADVDDPIRSKLDEIISDLWLEELGDQVEYVKFTSNP